MMKKVIYLCTSKSRYFVSPIQPKTLNEREGASGIRELCVTNVDSSKSTIILQNSILKKPAPCHPNFGTFAFFLPDWQTQKMQKSQNFPTAQPPQKKIAVQYIYSDSAIN